MLIYWLMFAFPSTFGVIEQAEDQPRLRFLFPWLLFTVGIALLIGLRWQTGGDWDAYVGMVDDYYWTTLDGGQLTDPGFDVLLWVASRMSAGVLVVTVASGVLMTYALTRFCLAQKRPWLAMAVSIPFMIVIMGMGYVRQGMAVSFVMLGILALSRGSLVRFIVYLVVAATFHSTAVMLLPIAGLVTSRYRILTIVMGGLLTSGVAAALLVSRFDSFQSGYVDAGMSSAGAVVRLVMTSLACAPLLLFTRRFAFTQRDVSFWRAYAIVPPLLLLMVPLFPSSTVLDRLGLYFLPVQTFVAGGFPDAFARTARGRYLLTIGVIVLYALAFFVWLNYAVNVSAWLPYRFYPLDDGI